MNDLEGDSRPDATSSGVKAAATGNVPYQWVQRRLFLGRFTDSDKIYFPDNGSFRLVELSPNVQMVQVGGANNLIVNMKDGLAVVDAPTDEGFMQAVSDCPQFGGVISRTLLSAAAPLSRHGTIWLWPSCARNVGVQCREPIYPMSQRIDGPDCKRLAANLGLLTYA